MRITAFAHVGIAGVDRDKVIENLNLRDAKKIHYDGVKNMPWKNTHMNNSCAEHSLDIFAMDLTFEYINYPCHQASLSDFVNENIEVENRKIKSSSIDADLISFLSSFVAFRCTDQEKIQINFPAIFPKGPVTLQYDEKSPKLSKSLDGPGIVTLAFYVTGLLGSELKHKFVESISPITTLRLGNQMLLIRIVKFKEIFVEFIERIKDN